MFLRSSRGADLCRAAVVQKNGAAFDRVFELLRDPEILAVAHQEECRKAQQCAGSA